MSSTWQREHAAKLARAVQARAGLGLPPSWQEVQGEKLSRAAELRQDLPGEPPVGVRVPAPAAAAEADTIPWDTLGRIEALGNYDDSQVSPKADWLTPDPPAPEPTSWDGCREKFNLNMEES